VAIENRLFSASERCRRPPPPGPRRGDAPASAADARIRIHRAMHGRARTDSGGAVE